MTPSSTPSRPRGRLNLAPTAYRQRLHLQRRCRGWLTALALYTAVASIGAGVYWGLRAADPGGVAGELAALKVRNDDTRAALQRLATQIARLRLAVDTRQTLVDQPDFSILLAFLADAVDRDTVLRQLSLRGTGIDPLRPVGPSSATPRASGAEREPKHFVLSLRGASRSESGLARLSAQLRESGLFDRVELRRTGRDGASGDDAVAFELDCVLLDVSGTDGVTPEGRPTALPATAGGVP